MPKVAFIANALFALTCALLSTKMSFAEPPNLGQVMAQIRTYHDSEAYTKDLANAYDEARAYLRFRVKINQGMKSPEKLAIVFDIDETTLSNYNNMAKRQFVADRETLHKETLAADAPVIQPALVFYNEVLASGVTPFFVTGRPESEREATVLNLTRAGYKNWSALYLKPTNYDKPSIVPFKSKMRANIEAQGYTVIASIGDQDSDLSGGFRERGFKLPNPYYHLP